MTYSRGVNLAGAEFTHDAAHLPGTADVDYMYATVADINYVASRGHKMIRLPFRWERIQPTLNAALNSAELARITTVVGYARAAGMRVLLDVHNYAEYINSVANGGATLKLGGGTLTNAHLTDLWTRLSTAFKGNAGVLGYGLMNEPNGMAAVLGTFSGTVRYDWASGVQGWTGDSATASNVAGQLRLSATVGAGTVNFRKDDAGTVSGGSTPTGVVLRAKVTLIAGSTAGTWSARLQWQNGSFAWINPVSTVLVRVDTGAVVSSFTTGVQTYVISTFSSITSPPNAFAVQIDGTGVSAGTATVDVDDFGQGTMVGARTEAQVWEESSQACVAAIRSNVDNTPIYVAGYSFSGAQNWLTNHPTPWIYDSQNQIVYEAHYYFDTGNSGSYTDTYATTNSAAISAGYASLTARATTEISRFTNWTTTNGVKGFIGEIGWTNNADTASWNAVGEAIYDILDFADVGASYWSAGEWWGTSYKLSVYTGTPLATAGSPAAIIEAHPTESDSMAALVVSTVGKAGTTPTPNTPTASDTVAIDSGLTLLFILGATGSNIVTVTDSGLTPAGNAGVSQTVTVPSGGTNFRTIQIPGSAQNSSTSAVTVANSAPTGAVIYVLRVYP